MRWRWRFKKVGDPCNRGILQKDHVTSSLTSENTCFLNRFDDVTELIIVRFCKFLSDDPLRENPRSCPPPYRRTLPLNCHLLPSRPEGNSGNNSSGNWNSCSEPQKTPPPSGVFQDKIWPEFCLVSFTSMEAPTNWNCTWNVGIISQSRGNAAPVWLRLKPIDRTRLILAVASLFSPLLFFHCRTKMLFSPQNNRYKLLHCQEVIATIMRQNPVSPKAIYPLTSFLYNLHCCSNREKQPLPTRTIWGH